MSSLAAAIPQEFINELLSHIDIVEIIDERVPLRKKGKNYVACCPFHSEKTASFTVTPEKQFYYCFGCAAGGNALSFLMAYEGLSFREAVHRLAEHCRLHVPAIEGSTFINKAPSDLYALMEEVTEFYQRMLKMSNRAITYLSDRGLSEEVIQQFRLGYAPASWDSLAKAFYKKAASLVKVGLLLEKRGGSGLYDRFRDRILFPIRDNKGKVLGFGGRVLDQSQPKYLNSPDTPFFQKAKALYGLYESYQKAASLTEQVLVVEGYIDVLALFQYNFPFAVATMGTAINRNQILRLFRRTKEIVFCFDGDAAGRKAAWRVMELSLELLEDGYSLRFLVLPDSEDPDSFIRKKGREGLVAYLKHSQSLEDFLFNNLLVQVDLSQLEGKARLAKLAIPLIEKLPIGLMQHKLYERLALLVNMNLMALKQTVKADRLSSPSLKTLRHPKVSLQQSPMRLAIALLLQYPSLIDTLSETECLILNRLELPGSELLNRLFLLLKEKPGLKSAFLLEYWRENATQYKIIKRLMSYPLVIPESGIQAEFHDVLQHLKKLATQEKIDRLLQRGKQFGLTAEEETTLCHLIKEK